MSLDYLVSAAALILFDQESPSPLACLNFFVSFIAEILDFSCCFSESPFHAEVRFIRREKSRISTLLSGVMYAKSIVIRANKRGDRGGARGGLKRKRLAQSGHCRPRESRVALWL